MKTTELLTLVALLILTRCVEVTAQDLSNLAPGDRIRVALLKAPNRKGFGIYHSHSDDAIIITLWKTGKRAKVPLAAIASLEVRRKTKRNTWAGVGIGLAVGAVTGGMIGSASGTSDPWFADSALPTLAGMAIGAPAGLFLGAIIGSEIKTEKWEEVPLEYGN